MASHTSASSSTAAYCSTPTSYPFYDIFINHRGPDVKGTFAAHLYRRLLDHGLRVFLDKPEMLPGHKITPQIQAAIQVACVHIAIFSPRYAESRWCLDELVHMVKCMIEERATILPVFYRVKPSDLRWTIKDGAYDSNAIQEWTNAISYAAEICGFELDVDEEELLNKVVEGVLKKVPKPLLDVAKYATGVEDKLQEFERTVSEGAEQQVKAKVVGIAGFGGVGKTTLAKAFFNRKRSDYKESSFLFEVRETSARKSLSYLQEKLIVDLKHINDIKIESRDEGIGILKRYLSNCHALVIIDDVDNADQLDGLLPMKDILSPKSLILVTTRDKHVLKESGVSSIYNLTGLNMSHSRELFCSHAFFQPFPPPEFQAELVDRFVTACDGLPLSLKVIGALLCGENELYWEEQFDLLRQSLPKEIQKKLRMSYDSLTGKDQEIFLDIACFFLGEDRDRAIRIWGLVGIRNLENKCLLEVDSENKIRMHDHIRGCARNIAEEGSMPRRLWNRTTDIIDDWLEQSPDVITDVRGITTVSSFCDFSRHPTFVNNYTSEMSQEKNISHIPGMRNLQLVATRGGYLEGILRRVRFPHLIWLRWNGCSDSSLPDWIPMEHLKVLEVEGYMLNCLWPHQSQGPLQLRELNIMAPLLEFPKSIGQLKHLEWISVNDIDATESAILVDEAYTVETLPQEFCHLRSLKYLVLKWFSRLMSLPDSFGNLTNLQYINLEGASSLQVLPNSFGDLSHLKHLSLKQCSSLQILPNSFGNLSRLKYLSLKWCSSLTISKGTLGNITTLEYLNLEGCGNVKELPPQVAHQRSLEKLYLRKTNLKELPSGIGVLCNLEILKIGNNSWEVLPPSVGYLKSLKHFKVYDSPKLKCLPDSIGLLTQLTVLRLVRCGIESLPPGLLKLNNLESLEVRDSPLRELQFKTVEGEAETLLLKGGKCMLGLTWLWLHGTKISEVVFPEGVCPNLQRLDLTDCRELRQIRGLCGLSKLNALRISSGVKVDLVSLENLRSLEEVSAIRCRKLKSIQGLAQLTQLLVVGSHEIVRLEGVEHCMSLGSLDVRDCPKLKSISRLGQLKKLWWIKVGGCHEIVRLPGVEHCLQVPTLNVLDCPKLKSIPELGQLTKLQWIHVRGCPEIVELPGVEHCLSLESLYVLDCPKLKCIPGLGQLTKIQTLHVSGCHEMVGLPCVEHCMSLQTLYVLDCPKLKSIPGLGQLTKLQWLKVSGCHEIVGLPGVEHCMWLQSLYVSDCPKLQWSGGVLQQLRRGLGKRLNIDVKQYKRRKLCA